MRPFWIAGLVLMAACTGGSNPPVAAVSTPPAVTPSPLSPSALPPQTTPLPASGPPATMLFAALEAKGTNNPGWNTVVIAGLDGYARAKTTFIPMPVPWVGCAGAVLPPSAEIAAGRVYFADGMGVIRYLATNGQVVQVTRLPMTSKQQMLSFAVNLSGTQVLGAIFTLPPKPSSGDPCTTGAPMFGPGQFSLDVYTAQSGSAATLLYHQDLPVSSTQPVPNVMAFIGWDRFGPEGTYPTAWATQGGGPHRFDGLPVRIDSNTGTVTGPVSDPNACEVEDIAPSGEYICIAANTTRISVRSTSDNEIWGYTLPSNPTYYLEFVSPDEYHVVAVGSSSEVINRDGSVTPIPSTFPVTGWLDSTTLVGGGYGTNFSYVYLGSPQTVVDIGFTGRFVGIVRD